MKDAEHPIEIQTSLGERVELLFGERHIDVAAHVVHADADDAQP